jgi:protein O-GlcNAc transferase
MTVPQALQIALQHHQSGRLADAEALYRQILAAQPNHADALHHLGIIANQVGRPDLAVDWIHQAITLDPKNPVAHSNLAEALRTTGRLDEAIAACRHALKLKPDYPNAHLHLGNALRERGRLDEAIAAYHRAIQLDPSFPEIHNNLGIALRERGRLDEAIAAYQRAIQLKPDMSGAHNNLGDALAEQGQLGEAIAAYHRALQLKPDYPDALYNLANALRDRGQLDEAIAAYRRALALKPDMPEAHNNLGVALAGLSQLDEAIAAYHRALALRPGYPDPHHNLGNALRDQGRLDEAVAAYRRALDLQPGFQGARNNLANTLRDRGQLDEAIAEYRHALELQPDQPWTHSNLIHTLHYHPDHNSRTISDEHRRWVRQFSDPLKPFLLPHTNNPDPNRPLRIGYVSPDFRDHPVGRFLLPLFERHDREQFEILCYSGVARPDWMTERLRALVQPNRGDPTAAWRNTLGVSDARLAEIIRDDAVDILVDVTMHTADNRLPLFARQPAPVQVTWLAYPGSTGLPAIGYRLTDSHMDPPNEAPSWSVEQPVRLPDSWCCYDPVGGSPEINALPALSTRSVTFGSLNNFAKVHDGVLALWSRVLSAVKESQLLMFCPEGQSRQRVQAFFSARGIAPKRLELVSYLKHWEYLKLYHRIDLALDPFPCNGMTTTCDALWMGVPVLTFPGATPASRAGLSLLSSAGLPSLAASSEEDYVRIATDLTANLLRLADLRATLRPQMQASPLMDAPHFTRNIEAAYRAMWKRWLLSQNPGHHEP